MLTKLHAALFVVVLYSIIALAAPPLFRFIDSLQGGIDSRSAEVSDLFQTLVATLCIGSLLFLVVRRPRTTRSV